MAVSVQRLRGERVWMWPAKRIVDRRGVEQYVPDPGRVLVTRCSESFDRSGNAEAPGQVVTEQISIRVGPEAAHVGSRGSAWFRGRWWDIVGPPAYRHGTPQVRHYTFLLAARPVAPMGLVEP